MCDIVLFGICLGDIDNIFRRLFNGYKDTFCSGFGFVVYVAFYGILTCFTVLYGLSSVNYVFFGC